MSKRTWGQERDMREVARARYAERTKELPISSTATWTAEETRERRIVNLMHDDFGGFPRLIAEAVVDGEMSLARARDLSALNATVEAGE